MSPLLKVATTTILGLLVLAATPVAFSQDKLKLGMLRVPNAAFIGIEKGFFREQNLDVEIVFFRSGAELVPSLSTGQIDVAGTTAGAV